jgi:hypothetical protein
MEHHLSGLRMKSFGQKTTIKTLAQKLQQKGFNCNKFWLRAPRQAAIEAPDSGNGGKYKLIADLTVGRGLIICFEKNRDQIMLLKVLEICVLEERL